jgi:hypothetical protein
MWVGPVFTENEKLDLWHSNTQLETSYTL